METTSSAAGDVGTGFGRPPGTYIKSLTEVGPGTPMGNLLRRYWHPVGLVLARHRNATRGAGAWGRPDPVPRQDRPAGAGASPLRASRHHALLRQGRGARHPLLLSRLAVRRRRSLPGTALRTRRRHVPRPRAPALVSRAGALRAGLRLHGPAREEAGAAALRMPRSPRRGRVHRCRRQQHRQRRPADRALQLAAAFRECRRSLSCRRPAWHAQRAAILGDDGAHAGRGAVRAHAARRPRIVDAPPCRRHRDARLGGSGAADPARRAQSARRRRRGEPGRPRRIDRLDLADRRHAFSHLRRWPRA